MGDGDKRSQTFAFACDPAAQIDPSLIHCHPTPGLLALAYQRTPVAVLERTIARL